MLVTSRERLHVRGEHEFAVPPLALPDPEHLPDLKALSQYEAVALFLERAQATKPDFQLALTNARALAEICARLDGLPLAIELAAARVKLLPPQTLLARLDQRLQVLASGARDMPARHQTLRDTIAWSYNLLNAQEQCLFRRLAVFLGGCPLEAVEAMSIALGDTDAAVLEGMASLLDKSLLQRTQREGQEPRFEMLETVREYGLERLKESGEAEVIQRVHAHYYLALAEAAEAELRGTNEKAWLGRLELEHQNLRAALNWAIAQGGEEIETALRLASALWPFWRAHGHLSEGRKILEQVLAHSKAALPAQRAKVLNAAGVLAGLQGSYEQAERLCGESLAIFRELGDQQGMASSLNFLAQVATWKSNYAQAHVLGGEALTIFRELGDQLGLVATLSTLAMASLNEGDYVQTHAFAEESLMCSTALGNAEGIARSLWLLAVGSLSQGDTPKAHALLLESQALSKELDDKRGIADTLVILAYIAFWRGEHERMRALLEEALTLHKAVGDRRGMALGLYGQGWLALSQGEYTLARSQFEESLTILMSLGHQWFAILCLEGLAATASAQGHLLHAARVWGAAAALRQRLRASAPPVLERTYERMVVKVRTQLGEEAFDTVWAQGQAMALQGSDLRRLGMEFAS